ncbi:MULTISPECIES: ABC transporter substrate-binding protein [Vagococcus]|uniref:Branched-chain amino acid ABC transporter, amino acid-binding protein (TC 3.A.1.4.1) n=1 Tax=Vagococcus fluvialis bH819 TaxID=1255619 RepID=A0A1X6WPZ5_9ENTE|nr:MULTISPECIES: ABC transporter substrate-binding protein [Vagococcus]SLM86411.1 Branched-chain amino acid ABC transporter, amino acid-binding protein (TC 3.A.1.4.1) [Vagococcus fluvialis bH819]HCM89066.1 branched-chain amino acid ABC transporter substrate-binding protein [Vagococcus sp.]
MKKIIGLLFASTILLTACGNPGGGSSGSSNKETSKESDTIKIGLNLELSGAVAAYGNQEKDGAQLAVDEINEKGGINGKKIELVIKDNKSDTAEAAAVAANLTTKENVVAIIGPATSGASKAQIPNVTKAKVPVITPSGTDDSITVLNDKVQEYIYRACFQDSFQGVILANYAMTNLKAKTAVVIGDVSSDYAKGLSTSFKDTFTGDIVADEKFNQKDKDFKAILTKIKDKDFDFIYLPGYYEEAGLIIKQAREMGIEQPILGADGFSDAKLIDIAGKENMNSVYYTAHFSEKAPASDKVKTFIDAFDKKYSKKPSSFNALAYDSVYMFADAIDRAGSADSEKITKELANLKDFDGVTGKMSMDKNHNPEKAAVVIGLKDGVEETADVVNP